MKYELGDLFSVDGIIGEVAFINRGFAWLVPIAEKTSKNGDVYLKGLVFAKIDKEGRTPNGSKASAVKPKGSGAV